MNDQLSMIVERFAACQSQNSHGNETHKQELAEWHKLSWELSPELAENVIRILDPNFYSDCIGWPKTKFLGLFESYSVDIDSIFDRARTVPIEFYLTQRARALEISADQSILSIAHYPLIRSMSINASNRSLLKKLSLFENLERLDISDGIELDEEECSELSTLSALQSLFIPISNANSSRMQLSLPQSLRKLYLLCIGEHKNLGLDWHIERPLNKLEALGLSYSQPISPNLFRQFSLAGKLTRLELENRDRMRVDDRQLVEATLNLDLIELRLETRQIFNRDCLSLAQLPRLSILCLEVPSVSDLGLCHLSRSRSLQSVHVQTVLSFSSVGLSSFADTEKLEVLSLSVCPLFGGDARAKTQNSLAPEAFTKLSQNRSLRSLSLIGHSQIKGSILKPLLQSKSIESLDFSFCKQLDSEVVRALAQIENLKELYLTNCPSLVAPALYSLRYAKQLKTLDLSDCENLTDDCVKSLARIPNLTKLDLRGCSQISGSSLWRLRHINRINVTFQDI